MCAMDSFNINRRGMLAGAGASVLAIGARGMEAQIAGGGRPPLPPAPDQIRRLAWWKEAKYGLFLHYGLYSVWGRQEWAVEKEAIPIPVYQELTKQYKPKPGFAKEWARVAKAGG